MAVAHGLKPLELPKSTKPLILDTPDLVEGVFSSLIQPLDLDPLAFMCIHFDAEWNISRHIGVSIIQISPHFCPNDIYIIPVCPEYSKPFNMADYKSFRSINLTTDFLCLCSVFWSVPGSSRLDQTSREILHDSKNNSLSLVSKRPSMS